MQEETPLLLTKKWLAVRFGFYASASGRVNYPALYRKVLTPEVLAGAGLSTDDVHRMNRATFNREQSARLIQILQL